MKINVPVEQPVVKAVKAEVVPAPSKLETMLKTEEGLTKLERMLRDTFTEDKIVQYIGDLCEAEDIKMTKEGAEWRTPNWTARKEGLDRVLELLRIRKQEKDGPGREHHNVVKLTFNVSAPTNLELKPGG